MIDLLRALKIKGPRRMVLPSVESYDFLFGDVSFEQWKPANDTNSSVWEPFEKAREARRRNNPQRAIEVLRRVTVATDVGSRHQLQAWHFLRRLKVMLSPDEQKQVLGVVVEIARVSKVTGLAVYRDYTAKLRDEGKEPRNWDKRDPAIDAEIDQLFRAVDLFAQTGGPASSRPHNKALSQKGQARVTVLKPSGLLFEEVRIDALSAHAKIDAIITAGEKMMQRVASRGSSALELEP